MAIEETEAGLEELNRMQDYFITKQKPMKFNPYDKDNILMEMERNFEETCASLEENGVADPKNMTEYSFYSRLMFYEKKYKKN